MAKKISLRPGGGRCTPHFRWWKIPLKTGIFGDDDDEESLCLSCYLVSILIRRDASSRVVSRPDHIIIIVTSNNNQPNQDCHNAVGDDDNRIVWSQQKYCGGIVLCIHYSVSRYFADISYFPTMASQEFICWAFSRVFTSSSFGGKSCHYRAGLLDFNLWGQCCSFW